jgi:hypothetical protein
VPPKDNFMKGRSCFCVLLLFAAGALRAQEEPYHSPVGCSGHAVQLDVERNPQLKFIPLQGIPGEAISYNRQHTFRFLYAGPFTFVTFHLAATIGEQPVGRAIPAKLGIYVEAKQDGFPQSPAQFWQLVSTATQTRSPDRTSERLVFASNRAAECLRNEDPQCEFAAPKLATPDPDIPLLDLSFMEDLGGANANNSQEAHILMDFRSSPPQVLVTADCAYNEGGGVCTAIDSGMAPRSDLQCEWVEDKNDFLCSEIRNPEGLAHRDYYLLSQAQPPLRNGEVATFEEAVKWLKLQPATTVKVRGVGAVAWVGELRVSPREKVIILGSQGLEAARDSISFRNRRMVWEFRSSSCRMISAKMTSRRGAPSMRTIGRWIRLYPLLRDQSTKTVVLACSGSWLSPLGIVCIGSALGKSIRHRIST